MTRDELESAGYSFYSDTHGKMWNVWTPAPDAQRISLTPFGAMPLNEAITLATDHFVIGRMCAKSERTS